MILRPPAFDRALLHSNRREIPGHVLLQCLTRGSYQTASGRHRGTMQVPGGYITPSKRFILKLKQRKQRVLLVNANF